MKRGFCTLLGLSICCLKLTAQELYKKAYQEFKYGDLKKSVELFKECIRKGEDTTHSYLYLAASNIYLGNYQEAANGLDKVNHIDSAIHKLHFYYGKLYLATNNYYKALENYNVELAIYPADSQTYGDRGVVRGILGDFDGAMADYAKAIEMSPGDPSIYSNRGYEFLKVKQYKKAMDDFTTSLKIAPTQKAYTDRGVLYFLIDSNLLAINDYTNALKLEPNDGETLYLRGVSYNKIQKFNEACDDFNRSWSLGYKGAKEMIDELHCR